MDFVGAISIGRLSNSGDSIRIEVQDETSRIRFLRLEMSAEDFTLALTGRSMMPIRFEVNGLQYIGKTREYKHEWIAVRKYMPRDQEDAELALRAQAFEIDGWKAQSTTSRAQGDTVTSDTETKVRVRFIRYV